MAILTTRLGLSKQASGDLNWDALINAALDILDNAQALGRSTVAGAATTDIWTGTKFSVDITGSPAITGFAAAPIAGDRRVLRASAALTITAGANMLIDGYASGQVVALAAGDRAEVEALSTTQFQIVVKRQGDLVPGVIQPVSASVAGNALTVTLNQTVIEFRNATLSTGGSTRLENASAISLVVPSSATLGTVNATLGRLILLAINNAGTMELAIVNQAGGTNLDETTLISTTAISAAATANNVIYSTTARTNVAFRVVGYIEATEATAGTWATAPSLVQGMGGQAGVGMQTLGMGQTTQTVTRTSGTTYYNTTGKPITLTAGLIGTNATSVNATININGTGAYVFSAGYGLGGGIVCAAGFAVIPPGQSYVITDNANVTSRTTTELR